MANSEVMNKAQKKKLCWNCEGSVSVNEEICPFCGVSVVPAFLEGAEVEFSPPYTAVSEKDYDIPKSPFALDEEEHNEESRKSHEDATDTGPALDEFRRSVVAAVLLLSGSVFFMFSMALGLFSHNGVMTLQWDGSYWYVYSLLALPLLLFGWRSLMKLDLQ